MTQVESGLRPHTDDDPKYLELRDVLTSVYGIDLSPEANPAQSCLAFARLVAAHPGDLLAEPHFKPHTVRIPDVWLSGWLGGPFARRKTPFKIIGPIGTNEMMEGLKNACAADIRIKIADENYPLEGIEVDSTEFAEKGVVYEKDGVRVTAFPVDHGKHIKPTFGYRIDFDGRSVMISGDTKFDGIVIRHGTGANLLIHEVAAVRPELLADPQVKRVMDHHTSPQEAGAVFARAKPRLAVYTHLVLLAKKNVAALSSEELVAQTGNV